MTPTLAIVVLVVLAVIAVCATPNGPVRGQRTPPGSKAPVIRLGVRPVLTEAEVCDYLTPGLIRTLGNLVSAPDSTVNTSLQLLPFGSRAALEAIGCASVDDDGTLTLTPLGRRVIDYAHGVYPYLGAASGQGTGRGSTPPPA